jgi:hypothetical protein
MQKKSVRCSVHPSYEIFSDAEIDTFPFVDCQSGKAVASLRMPDCYLLYIDILGFSELVLKKGRIEDLYDQIDTLNSHEHTAFKTLAFSDTILIYNTGECGRHYLVMYLCEFAQDLFYRLVSRDLHFRAYLCKGEFIHQRREHIQSFYGEALVRSYQREREIQCCGLFIENDLLPDCDVFHTEPYDTKCHFVHLMQSLDSIRFPDVTYPIPPSLIVDTDLEWELAENIVYLRTIHHHMHDVSLPPRVRTKYAMTWQMIRNRHKTLLDTLELSKFDPNSICDFDWTKAMDRAVNPE